MPRCYDESGFIADIPSSLTNVRTLLLYQEKKNDYTPVRCVFDPMGFFMILDVDKFLALLPGRIFDRFGASVGSSSWKNAFSIFNSKQPQEYMKKDIFNYQTANFLSFCIAYGPELNPRSYAFFITKDSEISNLYVKWLKILINNSRLLNPSLDLLIHREYFRLIGLKICVGKTYTKHLLDSLMCGKNSKIFLDLLVSHQIISSSKPLIINWTNFGIDNFKNFLLDVISRILDMIKMQL
ncbi:LOW QUALITY PROTEIN: hypothetical protein MXB_5340 [Myxobolus squamalis]|nr:LOW QUALITY PROTEIN: hypothetical protein MXB_5340 [Myxobolus squamalis]